MSKPGMSEAAAVALLELVFAGDEGRKKGSIKPPARQQLQRQGLISLEKRGRYEYIKTTEAAWDWAVNNLDLELERTVPRRLLGAVLSRVRAFLSAREVALAEFVRPAQSAPAGDATALETQVRAAYLQRSRGALGSRVRLSDLRASLPHLPRGQVDAALLELMRAGRLALFPLDDRRELRPEDEAAAIEVSGVPHHLIYLEEQA